MRSLKAVEDCDVALIIIDATQGFESQDMNLISLAVRYKKGIVILVNKWDLIEKDTHTANAFKHSINEKLGSMAHIPIIFISVLKTWLSKDCQFPWKIWTPCQFVPIC